MKIGYARVSTKYQRESLDQQIVLLKKPVAKKFIQKLLAVVVLSVLS